MKEINEQEFVKDWIDSRKNQESLDLNILEIIESCLSKTLPIKLHEEDLLNKLLNYADKGNAGELNDQKY